MPRSQTRLSSHLAKVIALASLGLWSLTAQAQPLSTEPNTDRGGKVLRHMDLSAANPELCRSSCASDRRCVSYTYVKPGIQGRKARCWLKSSIAAPIRNRCCISGIRTAARPTTRPAAKKPAARPTMRPAATPVGIGAGLGRWRQNAQLLQFAKSFKFAPVKFKRFMTARSAGLGAAKQLAAGSLDGVPVDAIARALFVLDTEAKGDALRFWSRLRGHSVDRFGQKVGVFPEIVEQTAFYHQLYDVPCRSTLRAVGTTWPPKYLCSESPKEVTREPEPVLELHGEPRVVLRAPGEREDKKDEVKTDPTLAKKRRERLKQRDFGASTENGRIPHENLPAAPPTEYCAQGACQYSPPGFPARECVNCSSRGCVDAKCKYPPPPAAGFPMPSKFCVQGNCQYSTYQAVAAAIYGGGRGSDSYPVFCAPRKVGDTWEKGQVQCSAQWLDTLGTWKPWQKRGVPSAPPESGEIPPFACVGSPHLLKQHMILPRGGEAGQSGFHCRNRLFRVLAKLAPKSQEDLDKNIVSACLEMRGQVWGEKYPSINQLYSEWCNSPDGPKDKSKCPKVEKGGSGPGGAPAQPFMLLTREELLYFYGHQELYCRADRPGLTHFLFNREWAPTFTCGISRGVVEAGPFEEGVQTCALIPYSGDEAQKGVLSKDDLKSRLHCWQFNRPTCEEVQRDQTKDDIHQSAIFDVIDALKEARRTRHPDAWKFYDMKDADKLQSWADQLGFQDSSGDESTFGVKEFCRFVGGKRKLRCGYTKQTMAQWYELHQSEEPEGCSSGICARGAYARGYYCGLFRSPELFCEKPEKDARGRALPGGIRAWPRDPIEACKMYWMCGIDTGLAGREMLKGAQAVCVGGERVKDFQSAKGDRSSLHCYERRFLWGESEESEQYLRRFDWEKAIEAAAKISPSYEPWLNGGKQADEVLARYRNWLKLAAPLAGMPGGSNIAKQLAAELGFVKIDPRDAEAAVTRGSIGAAFTFKDHAEQDGKELTRWASSYGHTLGHRTSLRLGLMRSSIGVIREFMNKLRFTEAREHRYRALRPPNQIHQYYEFEYKLDPNDKKDAARSGGKDGLAKTLNDLVDDVRRGSRPPDRNWYQEFRLAATDGGQLRIYPQQLEIAVRVTHLFEILARAREILFQEATGYANAVFAAAQKSERYTRLEVHERARGSGIPARFKGNVFCVASSDATEKGTYRPTYVCASSPLLVAGRVEQRVAEKLAWSRRKHESSAGIGKRQDSIRKEVSFDWCYGGTKGRSAYGENPLPVLYDQTLSSPFVMGLPDSVVDRGPLGKGEQPQKPSPKLRFRRKQPPPGTKPKLPSGRKRSERRGTELERLVRNPARVTLASSAETLPTTLLGAPARKPVSKRRAPATPRKAAAKPASMSKAEGDAVAAGFIRGMAAYWQHRYPPSTVNWLKCARFKYNDESWEEADPRREAQASTVATQDLQGAPPPPADAKPEDMQKTGEKTAQMASDVLNLLMPFIKMVLPDLGKALDTVRDLANQAQEFYEKYVKRFVDIATKIWKTREEVINKAKEAAEAAKTLRDKARQLDKDKALEFAAADPNMKAKLQAARDKAEEDLKDAEKALKEKQKAIVDAITGLAKQKDVPGTGDILNVLLEDLIKLIVSKIQPILEPNVRWLMGKIYDLIKPLVDAIGLAVVTAVGAIPFVGGALAPIAKFAFNYVIGELWKMAVKALDPLVERILSKMVRTVVSPIFNEVKKAVEKLVYGACSAAFGSEVCGKEVKFAALPTKDRWIARALACPPREIIDDRVRREAVAARHEVFQRLTAMRRKAPLYARGIADKYFARFGLTYDSWMAAVGSGRPEIVARVEVMEKELKMEAARLRAQMEKAPHDPRLLLPQ